MQRRRERVLSLPCNALDRGGSAPVDETDGSVLAPGLGLGLASWMAWNGMAWHGICVASPVGCMLPFLA